MSKSHSTESEELAMRELTQALAVLRDLCVNVSLMLRDYQFQIEDTSQSSVQTEVKAILEKVKIH